MIEHAEKIRAADIEVGDILVSYTYPADVYVVSEAETSKDIFGRPLRRYWCRRVDTGEEGYMSFGPGGMALRRLVW